MQVDTIHYRVQADTSLMIQVDTVHYSLQADTSLVIQVEPVHYLLQADTSLVINVEPVHYLLQADTYITDDTGGHSTLPLACRHNTSLMVKMDTVHYLLQAETSLMIRWTQYTISCRQTQQITYDKDRHSTLHVAGRHNTALIIQVDTVHYMLQVDRWTQYYSVRARRLSG